MNTNQIITNVCVPRSTLMIEGMAYIRAFTTILNTLTVNTNISICVHNFHVKKRYNTLGNVVHCCSFPWETALILHYYMRHLYFSVYKILFQWETSLILHYHMCCLNDQKPGFRSQSKKWQKVRLGEGRSRSQNRSKNRGGNL